MNSQQITTLAVVAVVAVIAIGGGLAYAAKDAEPGDMLYDLRASLYNDVAADADVEANLTGAREAYDEAQDLESRGQLTATERARLTATYSTHINAVMRRIAELEADGDTDAALEIRTSLRAALREFDDIFPNIEGNSASSAAMEDDDDSSVTATGSVNANTSAGTGTGAMNGGQSSSIFVQPSSSVTSA